MHSVIENDKKTIEQGKVLEEAMNQGLSSFTPSLMFQQLVTNYKQAKDIYGETIISALSGYDQSYVERNIKIPEFQRQIKTNIQEGIARLKKSDLVDDDGVMTEKGLELASLTMYIRELDDIAPKGVFGEYEHKKIFTYGVVGEERKYKKGDRYKDIALKKSIKLALRRSHTELLKEDLQVFTRHAKGRAYIIYALDASGSMKGQKIKAAKKAGIALAYKAIDKNDYVGLLVFKDDVEEEVSPTLDFGTLLKHLIKIRASRETNFANSILRSVDLFPQENVTKHLLLLTDALATHGKNPEQETLAAVANANSAGITVSVIGIKLDRVGEELAKKIVEIGEGRFYHVHDVENLKSIVLEDYSQFE